MEGLLLAGVGCDLISDQRDNPRVIRMWWGNELSEACIYCWNLTHGGGERDANEYRIQKTGLPKVLPHRNAGPTLILGYHAELRCFAGFDLQHHSVNRGASSSAQIPLSTLMAALDTGISLHVKSNGEVVIALRPEFLYSYAMTAGKLHRAESEADLLRGLAEAERQDYSGLVESSDFVRSRQATQTTRYVRDPTFRSRVTRAYEQRCAVSGVRLGLIDAAHILPVDGGGTDATSNGLALTPTLHRAFDKGLIYLSGDLVLRLDESKVERLRRAGLSDGLEQFTLHLNQPIARPANRADWPNPRMIESGNAYRCIGSS